jgi:hypothetical protein
MQRTALTILALATIVVGLAWAQSPRGSSKATIGGSEVSVEYGRPSLKGRDMLGQAPVGTVWRTGADQSTTFTTSGDITVGGTDIAAGSYSVFTKRVSEDMWHLVFNSETGQWGTSHDESRDVAEAMLNWKKDGSPTEQFTIDVSGSGSSGEIALKWGPHVLSASIEGK